MAESQALFLQKKRRFGKDGKGSGGFPKGGEGKGKGSFETEEVTEVFSDDEEYEGDGVEGVDWEWGAHYMQVEVEDAYAAARGAC